MTDRSDGWWVITGPWRDGDARGPYHTRERATETAALMAAKNPTDRILIVEAIVHQEMPSGGDACTCGHRRALHYGGPGGACRRCGSASCPKGFTPKVVR